MDAREARVLYLAVADGRGHLMRAHLLRQLLAERGLVVDVVTTSEAGQAFLAGLGTPAALLPGGFELLFDDCHRLLAQRTERKLAAYLGSPRGLARDVALLGRLAAGARFIVNDSLHPAALGWLAASPPVRAPRASSTCTATTCGARPCTTSTAGCPPLRAAAFRRLLEALDARAFGRIVHSLAPGDRPGRARRAESLSPSAAGGRAPAHPRRRPRRPGPRRPRAPGRDLPQPAFSRSASGPPHGDDARAGGVPLLRGVGALGGAARLARLRPRPLRRDRGQRSVRVGRGRCRGGAGAARGRAVAGAARRSARAGAEPRPGASPRASTRARSTRRSPRPSRRRSSALAPSRRAPAGTHGRAHPRAPTLDGGISFTRRSPQQGARRWNAT